jgi:hypothetical protein
MWMSVAQIVVVILIRASNAPTSGIGFSSSTMRPGPTKIAAFIFGMAASKVGLAVWLRLGDYDDVVEAPSS